MLTATFQVRFDRTVLRTNGQINDVLDGANSRKAAQKLASARQSESIASSGSPDTIDP